MNSFAGARKKLGEKVSYLRASVRRINWPRVSLSTNIEQGVTIPTTICTPLLYMSYWTYFYFVELNVYEMGIWRGPFRELQDVGDLEAAGEVEVNNSTMVENQNVLQEIMTDARVVAILRALLIPRRTQELPGGYKLLVLNVGISYKENSYLFWTGSVIVSLGSVLSLVSTFMQRRLPGGRCPHYVLLSFEALFLIGNIMVTISTFP